jgi:transcription initiation factor TFIIH subunit 1
LTHEIFEEFPVVQDAYARYVPGVSRIFHVQFFAERASSNGIMQISEAQFWSRYFSSQLWERHRASVRQSTNDEIARPKDDIFDQYLEEPDWGEY